MSSVVLGNVGQEVEHATAVTPLVVVPADELDEVLVEGDTGLGIEDGGVRVAVHVSGDDIVLSVGENSWGDIMLAFFWSWSVDKEKRGEVARKKVRTLEVASGSSLDGVLDLVVAGTLLEADGKINDGDVGGGHTHGHAGELAVELGDDLADGLGGAGAAGDDVLGSGTSTTPVLGGGAVDGLLGGSVGVDGGHETLDDSELVVDDLGERGQAVGGARGVGDDIGLAVVGLLVHAHDVHGGIGRGGRDDDLLGTTLEMGLGLVDGGEDTGGLDDVLGTRLGPGDGSGVALSVELDLLAVDDQVGALDRDGTVEDAVAGVVLEHVLLETGGKAISCKRQFLIGRLD